MQQLGARQRSRLARPQRRLRAGLVQLLCALGGLVLGLLLPRLSFESTVVSTRVTETLVAVGFAVLGLVSVVFSLLVLVVQWAFGSLSPRLNLFRDDPIVWRTFGFAVGVFVYSVTATLAIGDRQKVSVIVPAAEVVAVLAAVALIRTLQVKAFESIQLAPTLAAIAGEGRSPICQAGVPLFHCHRCAGPSHGHAGRRRCSSSTCAGCSVALAARSSCCGPA